jgi:AcrR family transcriptional regulator
MAQWQMEGRMPRAKKTEQEIQAMRQRILDAALKLLRQEGPEGLSIRKIADRIDVSHMLLYSYFENHAAIIQALRERGFEGMRAFCAEALRRAETGDALTQVCELLERFIQVMRDYPNLYELAWRRDLSLQVDSKNVDTIVQTLARLIQLCIDRGQCMERDPTLAAGMAFGIVNGMLMVYHNTSAFGQTPGEELETEAIGAAITYLTQPGAE